MQTRHLISFLNTLKQASGKIEYKLPSRAANPGRKENIMREYTFVIFKQINPTYAANDDSVVAYIHGTQRQAQEACNDYNSKNIGYHYFMDLEDARLTNPKI